MIGPANPLSNALGAAICGGPLDGNAIGRFADFAWTSLESSLIASWELELIGNLPRDAAAVYWFRDAVYQAHFERDDQVEIFPEASGDPFQVDFVLAPNNENYTRWPWLVLKETRAKAALSWRIAVGSGGKVTAVNVYQNATGASTVDSGNRVKQLKGNQLGFRVPGSNAGGVSGKTLTLSGIWNGDEETAEVTVAVIVAGGPGTGVVSYTHGSTTGTLTIQDRPQALYRGVQVEFENAEYAVGDEWIIRWGPYQTWTTDRLENGSHYWKVTTLNPLGIESDVEGLSAASLSVAAAPSETTLLGYDYNDGTGVVAARFQTAAETGIRNAYVHRNFPAEGIKDLWHDPVRVLDVGPGSLVAVTISGLQEGLNRIACFAENDGEIEDNINFLELLLDSGLNEYTDPVAPADVQASMLSSGFVGVTVYGVDSSSDEINIYGNGGSGSVDYSTPLLAITNPQESENQTLTGTIALADGTHTLAARAKSGTVEETNTDVTVEVSVNTAKANDPTNLAASLV